MLLGLQEVSINLLMHERWMQSEMRKMLNTAKVEQYAKEKQQGAGFPAPVVFVDHDQIYWTGDGFHRIKAEQKNDSSTVEVFLKSGTLKDAILHNIKANREGQGLLFLPGDLKKSVKTLLSSKEFKGWSRMKIHQTVGCSYSLVSVVAKQIGLPPAKTGVRPIVDADYIAEQMAGGRNRVELAKELGVGVRTLYRREISAQFTDCQHCHGSGKVLKNKKAAG